jgi:hypothetical protein
MKLSRTHKALFAGLLLAAPVLSQAATSWEFHYDDNCIAGSGGCGGWDSYRVYTDTDGSNAVTVKSYIATNSENINQGEVNAWSGLGAKKFGEGDSTPQHAMDNESNEFEAILFDFGAGNLVSLNSVSVGWWNTDSDVSVLALTGAYSDITALQWDQLLTNGWEDIAHMYNVNSWPGDTGTFNTDNAVASRYWLVGAYNPALNPSNTFTGTNTSWPTDYFKISGISGSYRQPPPPPVPEPATVLMMTLGLGFLGARRKRMG